MDDKTSQTMPVPVPVPPSGLKSGEQNLHVKVLRGQMFFFSAMFGEITVPMQRQIKF